MSDLVALHSEARRLTLVLRHGVDRLEASESRPHTPSSARLGREMHQKLTELQKTRAELDKMFRMHSMSSAIKDQELWKRKVEQISDETDHLRLALEKHDNRESRKQVEEQERDELLARRSNMPDWQSQAAEEAQQRASVGNSRRVLDEAYETGVAVLESMSDQRDRLKSAQRKIFDVMNSVGLSSSLLRLIDRRHKLDRWITYGGMVLVTLILLATWWWLRR